MFMKHPGELQSGKWQKRCATNSRCGLIICGVNTERVESHLVQEQLCLSHQVQGHNRSESTKMDISFLVSNLGTLHCLGEPKSSTANVPKGIRLQPESSKTKVMYHLLPHCLCSSICLYYSHWVPDVLNLNMYTACFSR